ncbi:MAG: hypothetical protein J3K34DRAFT_385703 [Monoraphidium minutum]|nr:MAG: hypothetical protein J3K34DRAFT_385703 [Monoraphidium minutum]
MSADALMEELQIMLATIASEAGAAQPPSRPPASRKVVAGLPLVKLDAAAAAAAAAAGDKCPVCCEPWQAGEEQQRLPCGHSFHPACNAPWLAQHNSCAICRHELPTDDTAYEARKERERELEEDRRGAANALTHNEFMYT